MALHPFVRPLGLFIATLGLVQSLVWFIFSIIAILYSYNVVELNVDLTTANGRLSTAIVLIYLSELDFADMNVDGNLRIFAFIYLVLSFTWFVISSYMFWLLRFNKWNNMRAYFIGWATIAGITSTIDLVLTGLIADDYNTISAADTIANVDFFIDTILLAIGIIMSVAARGYVLWLLNILTLTATIKLILMVKEEEDRPIMYGQETAINAFSSTNHNNYFAEVTNDNEPTPRISHVNGGFIDDDSSWSTSMSRSRQFDQEKSTQRYEYKGNAYNAYDNFPLPVQPPRETSPPLAKIGKASNKRSPNISKVLPPTVPKNAPSIPIPDYTPPSSPKLKSVLRSNHQYAA